MFDIGWQELSIIAVAAIVVVGPKDLPRALKAVTTAVRKVRVLAREFQSGVDEMVRESELDDLKQEMNAAVGGDLRKSIEDAVDPTGELKAGLQETADSARALDAPDESEADETGGADNTIAPPHPDVETETAEAAAADAAAADAAADAAAEAPVKSGKTG
ncbi:MAG: Sec-independent protein translocase protein TatB [Rhodospirillales bacterium]